MSTKLFRFSAIALAAVGLVSLYSISTASQDEGATAEAAMPMAKPTAEHAGLKADVGVWDAKLTVHSPMGEMESQGVETNRMLGEFWVLSDFEGNVMGMPFNGQATIGYDPNKKMYVGTWIDSMNTALTLMEGTADADGNITMKSQQMDAMTGAMQNVESVAKRQDEDHRTYESFVVGDDGKKTLMMTIAYTRKGK